MNALVKIENGLFVELVHDLYAGVFLFGPFPDEQAARAFDYSGRVSFCPDEVNLVRRDYVTRGGRVYVLEGVL